ncbi:MarR family transcriptional regulator [Nocardia camponoti]|uniref:Transcriptional regulator n=1 Tax=Nocardia camponoti TaxID=1616106 RepID=A0A917QL61_9NOCA|nr:MarR family transcriptional regulator [Nocardia camponoti]GGK55717.1 transcriptional regulator [Nocardia camponoti]
MYHPDDLPHAVGAPDVVEDSPLVTEWRKLLDRHASVSCALEKLLQSEFQIGLSEFETLDRLIEADCGKYAMADLAADIYLSQSALSRAVARLERNELVERTMCDHDRRAIFVRPTEKGRALHEQALPTHRETLERLWNS